MKSLIKFLVLIFFGFMATALLGQSESTNSGFVVHFDIGWTFSGPTVQMNDHMKDNNFDQTTQGWFGNTRHPKTDNFAPNIGLGFIKSISPSSNFGLSLQYSHLREISGATEEYDRLFVTFSSLQLTPSYARSLGGYTELKIGLPFMANSSKKTSRTGFDYSYSNVTVGILLGLNFEIYDGDKVTWNIGTHAILTYNNQIGKFTAGIDDSSILPESEVNFSHFNLKLILGIKSGNN